MSTSIHRRLFTYSAPRTCRISSEPKNIVARRYNSSQTQSKPSVSEKNILTWQDYLTIRGRKRRWELTATVPSIILGFGAGAAYFGGKDIDASKPIFGFDPLYVYGFATVACGGIGYLLGPVIGSSIWRVTHRKSLALFEARDRQFHQHIVKNRVDPTAQSATNLIPDFYGEKVGSLHQYRQWLRDQARYKRKSRWLEEKL